MVLTSFFDLLTSLYFWPPWFLTPIVFYLLASFCFGLFLVQSIHSMFDLSSIISLCCFWIFWPLVFTFTFGISHSETKWECRSCDVNKFWIISNISGSFSNLPWVNHSIEYIWNDKGGWGRTNSCLVKIWTYQLCMRVVVKKFVQKA